MELGVSFILAFISIMVQSASPFVSTINVIESEMDTEIMNVIIKNESSTVPIKLRCHDLAKKSTLRMDDIIWEYKKCGSGLGLVDCNELQQDTPWQYALCRNQSKLCTGLTLPIAAPSEEDSGIYRCLHKNYMNRQYRVNRVMRLDLTDFRRKALELLPEDFNVDNQTQIENGTTIFRCRVRSVKWPHIIWLREVDGNIYKDGQKQTFDFDGVRYQILNVSEIHKGPNKLYTSKLYIRNVQPKDAGFYYCYIMNERQTETKQVSLVVLSAGELEASSTLWFTICIVALTTIAVLCLFLLLMTFNRRLPASKAVNRNQDFQEVPTTPP